jgi:acyl-CoA hydrolase
MKVVAENVKMGTARHTNSSYFTMVSKGDDNKTAMVPELVLEEEIEVRRFLEALKRKEFSTAFRDRMQDVKSAFSRKDMNLLSEQRCIVGFV